MIKFFPKCRLFHFLAPFLILSNFACGPTVLIAQSQACVVAENALQDAKSIRGLRQIKTVPCSLQSKQEVKEFLLTTLKEEIPPERLMQEELIYKALSIIPQDYNYEQGLINLYLSQLGGYYDPKMKRFAMAAWLPLSMQVPVAVHELTHALQDQHFNLKQFLASDSFSTDELLARTALVEGDATAVMIDYNSRMLGRPTLAKLDSVNSLMMQNVLGAAMLAGSQGVPLGVQLVLVFPYTSGLRFVHQLLQDDSYRAVDAAFKKPPRSTEEILHPEKYHHPTADFRRLSDDDVMASFPDVKGVVEYSDTLGEFVISVVLAGYGVDRNESAVAASGWGGDRLLLVKRDNLDQDRVVLWKINWDSEQHAKRFIDVLSHAWQDHYQVKFSDGAVSNWRHLSKSLRVCLGRDKTVVSLGIIILS